ncbi:MULTISPECIES: hypothetical protein [unclassified Methanoculleus]|uniref:hypothetical protein n=1 Tax=unclassified Methanoculleus TaxID=2619537 RepID=UPI0025F1F87B|nr:MULTISPECIES: hypothetical protein [unclassified Methanoculleus]
MTDGTISLGEITAIIALLLSAYATWRTHKFKKREEELLDIQKKLNIFILDKEEREATQEKKADLGANFVTIGSNKHRLKIFNKGRATAYNVTIDFPEGNHMILDHDIEQKFPLESLERGQSVELIAVVGMSTKSKLAVRLFWQNEDGKKSDKTVHVTL